jgi:hypothetical protein
MRAKILAVRKLREAQRAEREALISGHRPFGTPTVAAAKRDLQAIENIERKFKCMCCKKTVNLETAKQYGFITVLQLVVVDDALEADGTPNVGNGYYREHYNVSGDDTFDVGLCHPCAIDIQIMRAETSLPPDVFRAEEEFK